MARKLLAHHDILRHDRQCHARVFFACYLFSVLLEPFRALFGFISTRGGMEDELFFDVGGLISRVFFGGVLFFFVFLGVFPSFLVFFCFFWCFCVILGVLGCFCAARVFLFYAR
jgi:hypothetical protein